tara:strand:- start:4279 stop:5382 length:1104 start_codon:yes stop_codon:yes gene_type:complete
MNKKLALVLFKYFPYGGLQKDFLGVSKELFSRDYEIKIYTRSWEGEIPSGYDVTELGNDGLSNFSKNKNFVENVKKSLSHFSPDIVFGFNKMPGLDLYFAADTCFRKQATLKHPVQKFTRRYKQALEYEKSVFSNSYNTRLLLLNKNQADDFQSFYNTDPDRMKIIPPGIEENWNLYSSINIHQLFDIPSEEKIILFVGSDFSRKGLDRAILGMHHLAKCNIPATLLVIGDDNKKPFMRSIKKLSLEKKVVFLGPRSDVASFMKSSDLLVHPAREEAAGNIIIEALVSGLPTLVSSEVGFSSEVLNFQSGEVVEGDFNQDKYNSILKEYLSSKRLISIKNSIKPLANKDYFYSRFRFIADFIEKTFQ